MQSVSRGFSRGYEANGVVYDPRRIGVPAMEKALRDASTFIKILESQGPGTFLFKRSRISGLCESGCGG